eukprot:CAMPEP_0171467832 /NCGR_PEP_ID=MMETSP0945-20130129/10232_1 /TAXON_ID=109269 /ORGANISM="Vaucheria litorea, Strain CCMP2940" /LENGTH=150 /DNA_ID=CAMNT_0011996477 /DNA_START=226 /DNA_END=674 /DNA_ORIENTATION=-
MASFDLDYGLCKELLDDMLSAGTIPNSWCYDAAILSCSKLNKFEEAFQLYLNMKQKLVKPSVDSVNYVLASCRNLHQLERVEMIESDMKKYGIRIKRRPFDVDFDIDKKTAFNHLDAVSQRVRSLKRKVKKAGDTNNGTAIFNCMQLAMA